MYPADIPQLTLRVEPDIATRLVKSIRTTGRFGSGDFTSAAQWAILSYSNIDI